MNGLSEDLRKLEIKGWWISYIKERTQAKGIWKQDPEANIWAQEWGVEKSPQWGTNIVRMIKSRRLRWAGHVARMEEGRSAFII